MKKIFVFVLILITIAGHSQSQFITAGKIEFEKKTNLHKEAEEDSWYRQYIDKIPKFRTTYHNLYFKDGKTLFEKGTEVNEKIPFFGDDATLDDVIYTDLKQGTFARKQTILNENFLLSDSIRQIKWQMTNELRDIAGFECHKAVGKIMDSVYVIAFYTDQITVSGGPLSYTNLPGMILGVAIPRTNMTIFATKVEVMEPKDQKMVPPAGKAKKVDYKAIQATMLKGVGDWGSYGRKMIMNYLL